MIMIATIREVWTSRLLVRDHATGQEVMVNTDCTKCLSTGDRVGIWYNGVMTKSLPPQISAIRIRRLFSCKNYVC